MCRRLATLNPNPNQACVSLTGLEDTQSLSTCVVGFTLLSAKPAIASYSARVTNKATKKVRSLSKLEQRNKLEQRLQLLGASVATAIYPLQVALLVKWLGTPLQGEMGKSVDEGDVIAVFEFATAVAAGATAGKALSEALSISRELDEKSKSIFNNPSLAALIGGLFTVVFTRLFNLPF